MLIQSGVSMPFTEQAQQYVDYFNQWNSLGTSQFNTGLSDLVVSAQESAVDHMAVLEQTHDIRREMLDLALGRNNVRDQQLQELDNLAQAAVGLLSDEQIEAKRAEIAAKHPQPSTAEQEFARGFVIAKVLGETILPSLALMGTPKTKEVPPAGPEYAGTLPVLTYREAFFLVGTLAGRGDRVQELRQEGIQFPSTEELETVWLQLRTSMSLDERQEIDAMFAQPTTTHNEELVRAERRRAADRVIQIIEAGEFGEQYEYLIDRFDELDPRCYVMDFIDSVPEEQLDTLHQLLRRIADPVVPIITMSGRTVGIAPAHAANTPKPDALEDAEQRPQDAFEVVEPVGDISYEPDVLPTTPEVAPTSPDTPEIAEWITNTVEEAFHSILEMYQLYGIDLSEKITTNDLAKFPTITFSLRTKAKGINGLLSESARKSSKKAHHDFVDTVLLAAYSLRDDLFDNVDEFSPEEQQILRSTRPREVRRIAEGLLRQHLEGNQTQQS
jgi:hypothetical protein